MQPISQRTEVKHCSSFCSLIVNPELKLTTKNRQKLTAHGLKNPVFTKYGSDRYIYIYIHTYFFFLPRREGNRIKSTRGVSYKNTRGVSYKNTRGVSYKNTRGVSYKNTRGVSYKNTRGVSYKNTRGVSCNNTRGVSCKILEVLNVH